MIRNYCASLTTFSYAGGQLLRFCGYKLEFETKLN